MSRFNRRNFLKASGLSIIPAMLPAMPAQAEEILSAPPEGPVIRFFGDSDSYNPSQYLEQLQAFHKKKPIERDNYGNGGSVAALEKKFEEITGKEKAIFLPTGTMANQFAIAVLSGNNTKVFVQDTSHVYRDEADAAQSVFQKRLMPLAMGETFFTAEALQQSIESLTREEVFSSGIGAVSIENPVRRTNGCMMPVEEIKKVHAYCRSNNIPMHLDGARIFIASAWSGISVKEYSSYFDTVYISLYKYLGASAGAILCGDKNLIAKMPHLMKIHGGAMYNNWANAAMALYKLETVEESFRNVVLKSSEIFAAFNKTKGLQVTPFLHGTNIYTLKLDPTVNAKVLQEELSRQFNIRIPPANNKHEIIISVNETITYRDSSYIIDSFKQAVMKAMA